MKKLDPAQGSRLINAGPVVIVTCGPVEKPNAITVAWNMVVSKTPPLVAVSIAPGRYSHDLIRDCGAFVINVPGRDHLDAVMVCGTRSGRSGDKFEPAGLTPVAADSVRTAAAAECPGRLECELFNTVSAGDHTIFIGEVRAAFADPALFDGCWKLNDERGRTLHHLGGSYFAVAVERIKV